MKKVLYSGVTIALVMLNNVVSAIDVKWTANTTAADNGTTGDFVWTLNTMFNYLIGLLYFVAVLFAVYGWFQILTAGWEEEKVKKWKTTLINAVIGLIVIFLASQIISWIISLATGTWAVIK